MPGKGVGHFNGQQACNLILALGNIQKPGPNENIVAVDCPHIDDLGILEKMNLPCQMIRFGSFHQVIESGSELFITRMAGGKLIIVTQGLIQSFTIM